MSSFALTELRFISIVPAVMSLVSIPVCVAKLLRLRSERISAGLLPDIPFAVNFAKSVLACIGSDPAVLPFTTPISITTLPLD